MVEPVDVLDCFLLLNSYPSGTGMHTHYHKRYQGRYSIVPIIRCYSASNQTTTNEGAHLSRASSRLTISESTMDSCRANTPKNRDFNDCTHLRVSHQHSAGENGARMPECCDICPHPSRCTRRVSRTSKKKKVRRQHKTRNRGNTYLCFGESHPDHNAPSRFQELDSERGMAKPRAQSQPTTIWPPGKYCLSNPHNLTRNQPMCYQMSHPTLDLSMYCAHIIEIHRLGLGTTAGSPIVGDVLGNHFVQPNFAPRNCFGK